MTLDKTPPGEKPIWNISVYIGRMEGGIQQVQYIEEHDTIAA
jgi:hypothetical protein